MNRENFDFSYTQEEWDFAIYYIADIFVNSNSFVKEFRNIYESDPIRFFTSASQNKFFNSNIITSYPMQRERTIKQIMGVLAFADRDETVKQSVIRILKRSYPSAYEFFKKFSNKVLLKYLSEVPEEEDDTKSRLRAAVHFYLMKALLDDEKISLLNSKDSLSDLNEKKINHRIENITEYDFYWATIKQNLAIENFEIKSNFRIVQSQSHNFWKDKEITLTEIENKFVELPSQPYDLLELSLGLENEKFKREHCWPRNLIKLNEYEKYSSDRGISLEENPLNRIRVQIQLLFELFKENGIDPDRFFMRTELYKGASECLKRYSINVNSISGHYRFDPVTYTYLYFLYCLLIEYKDLKNEFRNSFPEAQYEQINDLTDEIGDLRESLSEEEYKAKSLAYELEIAQKQLSQNQKEERSVKWNIESSYNERINELEKEVERLKKGETELHNLRIFFFRLQHEETNAETKRNYRKELKELTRGKNIITVGGHTQLRKQIKTAFPDFTVLDGTLNTQSFSEVESADHVFLLVQNMSHSTYYKVIEKLENKDIPYSYLDKTNIDLAAELMIENLSSNR